MDQVTQQNAALVEEASAAAQSMSAQSSTLRDVVSIFRLGVDPSKADLATPQSEVAAAPPFKPGQKRTVPGMSAIRDTARSPTEWTSF
jgi:methyl-accepting chemotaxis protein